MCRFSIDSKVEAPARSMLIAKLRTLHDVGAGIDQSVRQMGRLQRVDVEKYKTRMYDGRTVRWFSRTEAHMLTRVATVLMAPAGTEARV